MPRRPAAKSRSRSKSRPEAAFSVLRTLFGKLRDLAIGLAFITVVSFLPQPVVQELPDSAQRAVGIAGDIRDLAITVSVDTGVWTKDLAANLTLALVDELPDLSDRLANFQLPDWWPRSTGEIALPTNAPPHVAETFGTAKKTLYERIYADHRATFYCGCRFDRGTEVSLSSCGLQSLAGVKRAHRVEAEHVFPAAQFGQSRRCWREPETFTACRTRDGDTLSGRSCCLKVDSTFIAAHNDLHNLFPAVGHINGQRSNYNWGMVRGGKQYDQCEMLIDSGTRRAQPPVAVRGDIARTMLYMRDTYGFRLSRQDERLYGAWNNADPPDSWEIARDRRIKAVQGMGNAYVDAYRKL